MEKKEERKKEKFNIQIGNKKEGASKIRQQVRFWLKCLVKMEGNALKTYELISFGVFIL